MLVNRLKHVSLFLKLAPIWTLSLGCYCTMHKRTESHPAWLRLKRYPHIGTPISLGDISRVVKIVQNPDYIRQHAFFPFVHRRSTKRKFRRFTDSNGKRSGGRKKTLKQREIYYANHLDSVVYSYYAYLLNREYEDILKSSAIDDCITAYRRIPTNPSDPKSRNKCSVDFAGEIFSYILKSEHRVLAVLTFDISAFFDTLNHDILKKQWRRVMNSGKCLPPDHYAVYKNITRFSYVEEKQLFRHFAKKIIVEKPNGSHRKIACKRIKYLRNKNAIAFCERSDIAELRENGLILSNKRDRKTRDNPTRSMGIPQGSPISAVLANIYMLDFDKRIHAYLSSRDGVYRRYSDDMVAICPTDQMSDIIAFFKACICDVKLELQDSKTQVFVFEKQASGSARTCYALDLNTNSLSATSNLEYLGFQFDGSSVLLKNASLSSFYRRMKRAIHIGKYLSRHNRTKTKGELFKSRLYKKFTYKGASRRRVYRRVRGETKKWVKSHKYDWGNFVTYASFASQHLPNNKIKGQLKNHWKIFHRLMKNDK